MKNISNSLKEHVKNETTTLCYCFLLTRRDQEKFAFTSHDKDLELDGEKYLATSGFSPSSISNNSELSVDNLELAGVLDNISLKDSDILAGIYDFAEIEIFLVNYNKLSDGRLQLRTGWLGEVKFSENKFVAEVRGLTQKLSQTIGELYSPRCRAVFADSKCGLVLNNYKKTGVVENIVANNIFVDSNRNEDVGFFNHGKIKFASGKNQEQTIEIKRFADSQIELVLPLVFDMQIGDYYEIFQGCDKILNTCINRYNNAVNFRGEPHIPGLDKVLKTA